MSAAADLHVLTGVYAGGALYGEEHDEFVRHLRHCPPCAVEVRELREITAVLGSAVAQPAPRSLRLAVYDEIARMSLTA